MIQDFAVRQIFSRGFVRPSDMQKASRSNFPHDTCKIEQSKESREMSMNIQKIPSGGGNALNNEMEKLRYCGCFLPFQCCFFTPSMSPMATPIRCFMGGGLELNFSFLFPAT